MNIIKKALVPFLFLAVLTNTFAQENHNGMNFPFQIIYAENVNNSKGENIKALDLIGVDEVLTVRKNGFLSMVHYFGFPVEVTGDSLISIKNLDFIIDNSQGRKKRKAYESSAKPNIDYLHITEPRLARKGKLSASRTCHDDCNPFIDVLYPPIYKSFQLNYTDDLCLDWKDTRTPIYKIEIRSGSGHVVKKIAATENHLKIEASVLDSLKSPNEFLLLTIRDTVTQKASHLFTVSKYPKNLKNPFTCAIEKSTFALLAALNIELSEGDNNAEAEKYYKLAARLSEKAFYKEMLDNFKRRHEK